MEPVRIVEPGVWILVCEAWGVDPGLWSLGCGSWFVEPGCGSWVVDPGLWSLGCGSWFVEIVEPYRYLFKNVKYLIVNRSVIICYYLYYCCFK